MTADNLFYQQFSLLTDEQKAAVLLVIQTFLGKKQPNKPTAPIPKKRSGYGSLKGKIWMSPDFDAPLEEMKEYME
jgi:Protein of unknown function (DUF2281)